MTFKIGMRRAAVITAAAAAVAFTLFGCGTTSPTHESVSDSTMAGSTAVTTTSATTSAATSSSAAVPPPDTTAIDSAACAEFRNVDFLSGLGDAITTVTSKSLADSMIQVAAKIYSPVNAQAISPGMYSKIGEGITGLNSAVKTLTVVMVTNRDPGTDQVIASYNAVVGACTSAGYSVAPQPGSVRFNCRAKPSVGKSSLQFVRYQDVWAADGQAQLDKQSDPTTTCTTKVVPPYTETQTAALATAKSSGGYSSDDDYELRRMFGVCINPKDAGPTAATAGSGQAGVGTYRGALLLCPDHPKAAAIQQKIDVIQADIDARAAGAVADEGKHLVGTDIQPGTWQSVGTKVTDCYWEISDAQGDIIDNNFISIAPQFTIEIPASAAGFTNTGCRFTRIGS